MHTGGAVAGTHGNFVKAWEDMEEDLSRAKGNLALALHKPMGETVTTLAVCLPGCCHLCW